MRFKERKKPFNISHRLDSIYLFCSINIPYNEIITYLEVFMKIVVDGNYYVVSIEYDEKTTDSDKITINIKNEVSLTKDE